MARPEETIGALAPWQRLHQTQVRIRYSETDQMGIVYYGRYAEYCEIARTEWIRALGLTYAEMERSWGLLLPVRTFHISYHRPARYDDLLTIYTWLTQPITARIAFAHAFYHRTELIAEAQVTLVFINAQTWRPCRPPEAFYVALAHQAS
jgi:acyl-CoA thioester hydrolase